MALALLKLPLSWLALLGGGIAMLSAVIGLL
jgi:hypothetical protein